MEDVIFAGTRDRKPNGMAEVSLTLINPEEYDGVDANEPTEVDIRDDMPDDWDEAEVRAQAAEETERLTAGTGAGSAIVAVDGAGRVASATAGRGAGDTGAG